jgi:hypothetical protein
VQSRKRFPKEGRLVRTGRGEEKLISNDIFRDRVTLRGADGELRTITLAELREEANAAGAPLPMPSGPSFTPPASGDDDVAIEDATIENTADETESAMSGDPDDTLQPVSDAAAEESEAAAGERKAHRRRGRRGGRRNRSGHRGNPDSESKPGGSSENA